MQLLLLHYCFSSVQCAVQGADVSQQADAVHGAGLQLLLAGWLLTRIRAVFREGVLSQLSNEAYGQYCEPTTKLGLLPQCHYFAILSAFGCTFPSHSHWSFMSIYQNTSLGHSIHVADNGLQIILSTPACFLGTSCIYLRSISLLKYIITPTHANRPAENKFLGQHVMNSKWILINITAREQNIFQAPHRWRMVEQDSLRSSVMWENTSIIKSGARRTLMCNITRQQERINKNRFIPVTV